MHITLQRLSDDGNQTLGALQFGIFRCKTLELPWRNNQRKISCIPPGRYNVAKHISPKFGHCLHVQNVKDRDHILIHAGNYHRDTLGCILPGKSHTDIDGDGLRDVTSSKATLIELMSALPPSCTMHVIAVPK